MLWEIQIFYVRLCITWIQIWDTLGQQRWHISGGTVECLLLLKLAWVGVCRWPLICSCPWKLLRWQDRERGISWKITCWWLSQKGKPAKQPLKPQKESQSSLLQGSAGGSYNSLICRYDSDEFMLTFTHMPWQHSLKILEDKHKILPFLINLPKIRALFYISASSLCQYLAFQA